MVFHSHWSHWNEQIWPIFLSTSNKVKQVPIPFFPYGTAIIHKSYEKIIQLYRRIIINGQGKVCYMLLRYFLITQKRGDYD